MGTDTDLYSLVYFSRSTVEPGRVEEEIRSILDSARKQNSKRDVTGALLFSRGFFAQVLEGPLSSIQSTLEKIRTDTRHTDVSVLSCRPVARRNFASWSMAYAKADRSGGLSGGLKGFWRIHPVLIATTSAARSSASCRCCSREVRRSGERGERPSSDVSVSQVRTHRPGAPISSSGVFVSRIKNRDASTSLCGGRASCLLCQV